ncbi:MAG: flagellar hook-associated protein FlgK [Thiobacillaceae bacterium]
MASGILGIGITGLNAAMGAVRTTQHNIANANTPGFHRQEVQLAANPPTYSGAGFFGNGVAVATVTRVYSQFLDNELMRSQGQQARYEVYSAYAGQIDRVLGDKDSGLNSALSSFFGAVQEVANDPTSLAAREAMLAAGRNLAGRMNNLGATLDGMLLSINSEMSAIAAQANTYVRRIADLSERIAMMQAMGGNPPNDLIDQREQLTAELNKLIDVTVLRGGDGSYNLYVGGGQPLLVGNQPNLLGVTTDPYDSDLKVLTLSVGGATLNLDENLVTGGRLGGLLALREEVLQPARQDLGRVAIGLAKSFNDLHSGGYALDGTTTGLNFFVQPALRNFSAAIGTANVTTSLSDAKKLRSDDYTLTYDGTNYALTRSSDGVAYTGASLAALSAAVSAGEGFNIALAAGTINPGDRYELRKHMADGAIGFAIAAAVNGQPGRIAAASVPMSPGDGSKALQMAQLQTQPYLAGATVTFHGAYGMLVARTANLAGEADIALEAYDTLSRQALENQQALSGVNLDEEAANLIRFQQAYQAAARAMQVATSLLDEVLSIGR